MFLYKLYVYEPKFGVYDPKLGVYDPKLGVYDIFSFKNIYT